MSSNAPPASPPPADEPEDGPRIPRFPAQEEASMLATARALRASANALFAISDYDGAVAGYERALAALPAYRDYEAAVVRANMAACFVKTAAWKSAAREADRGLEALADWEKERERKAVEEDAGEDVDAGEADHGQEPTAGDVRRIRSKLLLRRAKANAEMGGWAALQRALEGEECTVAEFKLMEQIIRLCQSGMTCQRWTGKRSARR
jgi:hypothetical protein